MRVNDVPTIESYVVGDDDSPSLLYRIAYGDSYGHKGGFETWEKAAVELQEWVNNRLYDVARHTVQLHKVSRYLKRRGVTCRG